MDYLLFFNNEEGEVFPMALSQQQNNCEMEPHQGSKDCYESIIEVLCKNIFLENVEHMPTIEDFIFEKYSPTDSKPELEHKLEPLIKSIQWVDSCDELLATLAKEEDSLIVEEELKCFPSCRITMISHK